MANELTLRSAGSAPFALTATTVPTGGSGWPAAACSFAVGAWYSADESDFDNLRILNVRDAGYGSEHSEAYVNESGGWNKPLASTSIVTLGWTPPRRRPHHYSVYCALGPFFDRAGNVLARKVLPASGLAHGNIPGSATSVELTSGVGVVQRRSVPVLRVDGASGAIDLPGWRGLSCCADGTHTVTLKDVPNWPDGPYAVTKITREWTAEGEVTRLTLFGYGGGSTDRGGTCTYDVGPLCLDTAHLRPAVTLSLEHLLAPEPRQLTAPDYRGRLVPLSLLAPTLHQRVSLELAYGGVTPGGLHLLNKYAQLGGEVVLTDANDSGSAYLRQWHGTLSAPSTHGGVKRQGDSIRFDLQVHSQRQLAGERGWLSIIAGSAGSNTLSVHGDETARLAPGCGLYVSGSTSNDGVWAVASSAYDALTNRTTLTVTGDLPSSTADGHLEVYEW